MAEEDRTSEEGQERPSVTFKVTDRRLFTREGELRCDVVAEREREQAQVRQRAEQRAASEAARSGPQTQGAGFEHRPLEEPEGVDFTMLVNAMAQPALLFLGEIPHPATGERRLDLEQARIQIDMLGLLRVKCRGNLTTQEEALLERVLYELRMLYVARTNRVTS